MTKEELKDYGIKVTQASRAGLISLTFDLAIRYLEEAVEEHKKGNDEEFRNCLCKSKAFINELSASLDMQYEISVRLLSLYIFIYKAMVKADIKKDASELVRIIEMLKKLRDAFEEAGKNTSQEPVMENTQRLYAGLTYSKTSLNEEIYSDTNRGFTV